MNMPRVSRLEREITQLPSEEQRWLVDRLTGRLGRNSAKPAENDESRLAAMAADPEIVSELRTIDEDFRATASDGLADRDPDGAPRRPPEDV